MARPERFELPTAWFVARYSIQLSYGRVLEARDYPLAQSKVQVYEQSQDIKKAPVRGLMCVAESEGFEPSMGVNPYALSRGAPSATRPALLTA